MILIGFRIISFFFFTETVSYMSTNVIKIEIQNENHNANGTILAKLDRRSILGQFESQKFRSQFD